METSIFLIVVVDDDIDDLYLTGLALAMEYPDAKVHHITTLAEWQTYWATSQTTPSLVLMDFRLPLVTGLDLLTQLKQHPNHRHAPVVMWSGSANAEEVEACCRAGAAGYVQKPTNLHDLRQHAKALRPFCPSAA